MAEGERGSLSNQGKRLRYMITVLWRRRVLLLESLLCWIRFYRRVRLIASVYKEMKGKINLTTIIGIFSPIISKHEERAAEIVCDVLSVDV